MHSRDLHPRRACADRDIRDQRPDLVWYKPLSAFPSVMSGSGEAAIMLKTKGRASVMRQY